MKAKLMLIWFTELEKGIIKEDFNTWLINRVISQAARIAELEATLRQVDGVMDIFATKGIVGQRNLSKIDAEMWANVHLGVQAALENTAKAEKEKP